MENPFFSVVVVSLNAGLLMKHTMDSICAQTFRDYEVIVKDGRSEDDTLRYVPEETNVKVYCRKDSGIYDAMNQAVSCTRGKYLIFMNCGDVFSSDTVLEEIRREIGAEAYAMVYGDYSREGMIHRQPTALTPFYLYRTPLCHQTIFFDGNLMRNGHLYDTDYRILADYDLELQILNEHLPIRHCGVCICDYAGGGVSESEKGVVQKTKERKIILRNRFPSGQRRKFGLVLHLTLPGLRRKITDSAYSPRWLKKTYQTVVNRCNK